MTKPQPKKSSAPRASHKPKAEAPSVPGGKLGIILKRLAAKAGATVDELAEVTGWQKHTVHGALSRLRGRGFAMASQVEGAQKRYRLSRA